VPEYKTKLEAFIDWHLADGCLKQEIQSLQKAAANRKQLSKKTIKLKIVDAETYIVYREELAQKQANKRSSKKKANQPRKSRFNNR
jgi:hypothetical protein